MSILRRAVAVALLANALSSERAPAAKTPRHDHHLKGEIYEKIRRVRNEYQDLKRRWSHDTKLRATYPTYTVLNNEMEEKIQELKDTYRESTGMYYDQI